ncbi:hypothetical protein GCM10010275_50440 [Streptomyces litmocidini]|nr:hypothetical protein GCM10010275_50440 [Streptomyces litmocidini]
MPGRGTVPCAALPPSRGPSPRGTTARTGPRRVRDGVPLSPDGDVRERRARSAGGSGGPAAGGGRVGEDPVTRGRPPSRPSPGCPRTGGPAGPWTGPDPTPHGGPECAPPKW